MRKLPFLILLSVVLLLGISPAWAANNTILVFGDSLSAGYGIRSSEAWPSLLDARLKERKLDYTVANLSISGETSAGGRSRLPAALALHKPAIVLIELGANDGLRGLSLEQLRENLKAMIADAKANKARVVVIGMRLPPNYGPYATQFNRLFEDIAKSEKVSRVDFLLAGIAEQASNFLPDRLHPVAAAQPRLLDNVWPTLLPLLKTQK